MKNNKILLSILAGSYLLASLSCTREIPDRVTHEETSCVPVAFSLTLADMEKGTPETKTVIEPETIDPATTAKLVDNFVILQFKGNDDGAKIVGGKNPYAYDDPDGEYVSLVPSDEEYSGPFTIIAIANTPADKIFTKADMTLGEFRKGWSDFSTYTDVFSRGKDGNDYLRMSGSVEVPDINFGDAIEVTLKRNVSKITVNVKNETSGDDKVTLQKVQLRDINGKYYYLTPLDGDKEPDFVDEYSTANPCRIDKEQEDFPAAGNDGTVQTFTYYVPANLRGETENQKQYTKGLNAPEGATRFCMYGSYGEGENTTSINYTYYLGANLVNDFNLKPNYHYTYNITLSAKGDARYDYRVEDLAEVKFHVDANCYMVHPPKMGSRIYAIPIRRAATFWNKEGENGGVYGANQWEERDYSAFTITPETEWTAEVIGSDFPVPSDFLKKTTGKGYDPTQPAQDPYFKIKVNAGMKGNAQIAVKVGDNIVWSWHIWITDYNPDQEDLTPIAGKYLYDVEGGQVHRYNNSLFNTTEPTETTVGYKKGFIMDRNLGAWGTSFEQQKKAMYYQFGRKDPFWVKDNRKRTFHLDTGEPKGETSFGPMGKNIRYAICHPREYIWYDSQNKIRTKNVGWTYYLDEDKISCSGEGWFDSKFYQHIGNQDILEIKKSIYDPCPPGWKIPNANFVSDIVRQGESRSPIKHPSYIDNIEYTGIGHNYYPEGMDKKEKTGEVYFPATSLIVEQGTNVAELQNQYSRLWADKTNTKDDGSGYNLNLKSMETASMSAFTMSHGYPVRCVREYGVVNK